MCDACMDKFRKMRDSIRPYSDNDVKNTKTIENEVQELKNTVTDILATLSKLVSTTSTRMMLNFCTALQIRYLHSAMEQMDVLPPN